MTDREEVIMRLGQAALPIKIVDAEGVTPFHIRKDIPGLEEECCDEELSYNEYTRVGRTKFRVMKGF